MACEGPELEDCLIMLGMIDEPKKELVVPRRRPLPPLQEIRVVQKQPANKKKRGFFRRRQSKKKQSQLSFHQKANNSDDTVHSDMYSSSLEGVKEDEDVITVQDEAVQPSDGHPKISIQPLERSLTRREIKQNLRHTRAKIKEGRHTKRAELKQGLRNARANYRQGIITRKLMVKEGRTRLKVLKQRERARRIDPDINEEYLEKYWPLCQQEAGEITKVVRQRDIKKDDVIKKDDCSEISPMSVSKHTSLQEDGSDEESSDEGSIDSLDDDTTVASVATAITSTFKKLVFSL